MTTESGQHPSSTMGAMERHDWSQKADAPGGVCNCMRPYGHPIHAPEPWFSQFADMAWRGWLAALGLGAVGTTEQCVAAYPAFAAWWNEMGLSTLSPDIRPDWPMP